MMTLALLVAATSCTPRPRDAARPLTVVVRDAAARDAVRELAEIFTADTGIAVRVVAGSTSDAGGHGFDLLLDSDDAAFATPAGDGLGSATVAVVALAPPTAEEASTRTLRVAVPSRADVHSYAREFRGRLLGDEGRAVLEKHGLTPPPEQ